MPKYELPVEITEQQLAVPLKGHTKQIFKHVPTHLLQVGQGLRLSQEWARLPAIVEEPSLVVDAFDGKLTYRCSENVLAATCLTVDLCEIPRLDQIQPAFGF